MKSPLLSIIIAIFLINSVIGPFPDLQAQDFRLPVPGTRVNLSSEYNPPLLKGIKVHTDNPFRFDFILDSGDGGVRHAVPLQDELKFESIKLIKYFLASLTIPEKDLWVNLSPYEKNRIIPDSFGLTEMGRDLLAEDYMLKQITASLIYPEDDIGKKFWKRIYEEAYRKFGTTNIPVNTFNKVWIVPEKAVVYENAKAGTAYVVESKLKVMLEQDYLALSKNNAQYSLPLVGRIRERGDVSSLGSNIVREIIIPELTKEVNEGRNFSQLRQVYNSLILATWYKKKIKDSILSMVYADKNKVSGINMDAPREKERIYQQYLMAFKKGAFNFIKDDIDPATQQIIPRKYFSGGVDFAMSGNTTIKGIGSGIKELIKETTVLPASESEKPLFIIEDNMAVTNTALINQLRAGQLIWPSGSVSLDLKSFSNGSDQAMLTEAEFTRIARQEISFEQAAVDVLASQGISPDSDLVSLDRGKVESVINGILDKSRLAANEIVFRRMSMQMITPESIGIYAQKFGGFNAKDLILVLQRLHTLSQQLALYGLQEDMFADPQAMAWLKVTMPTSQAIVYRILTKAGVAGEAWEATTADQEIIRSLTNGDVQEAFKRIARKNFQQILPQLKAFVEFYGINIAEMQKDFLQSLIFPRQSAGDFEKKSEQGKEVFLEDTAAQLKGKLIQDLVQLIVMTHMLKADFGYSVTKLLGRGWDGIVLKAVDTKGNNRAVKINFPQNGINAEEFFITLNRLAKEIQERPGVIRQNANIVYLGNVRHPGFVKTYSIMHMPLRILGAGGGQTEIETVIEINEFVQGTTLREIISAHTPQPQSLLDLARQFMDIHQYLLSRGFVNRDARNLNNIMVNASGQAKLVDFGNVITPLQYGRYLRETRPQLFGNLSQAELSARSLIENKKDFILAVIRILTGIQFQSLDNPNEDRVILQQLLMKRLGVDQKLIAPLVEDILTGWQEDTLFLADIVSRLTQEIDRLQQDRAMLMDDGFIKSANREIELARLIEEEISKRRFKDVKDIIRNVIDLNVPVEDRVQNEIFKAILYKYLDSDQREGYLRKFGRTTNRDITNRDLIMIVQKVHTRVSHMTAYGMRPEAFSQISLADLMDKNQIPVSNAMLLRVLESSGLAGKNWDGIEADTQMKSLLLRGDFNTAFDILSRGNASNDRGQIKALMEYFIVDPLGMGNVFLEAFIRKFQLKNQFIEKYPMEQQSQIISGVASDFNKKLKEDLLITLRFSGILQTEGLKVDRILGRGRDGIVMHATGPRGKELAIKLNIPIGNLKLDMLYGNLNNAVRHVQGLTPAVETDSKVQYEGQAAQGFVKTISVEKKNIVIPAENGQSRTIDVVIEINEFHDGESLFNQMNASDITSERLMSFVQKFAGLHRALADKGFYDADFGNHLNNILVDSLGTARLVDYGEVRPLTQMMVRENKQGIIRSIIWILTGQHFGHIGPLGKTFISNLMRSRLNGQDKQKAESILDLLIKSWDDDSVSVTAMCQKAGDLAMAGLNPRSLTVKDQLPGKNLMMLRKGGIDLTPAQMNFQTKSSGSEIKFHIDPAMIRQWQNAPGFVPVIINIKPVGDLRRFMGINVQKEIPAIN